ncbi:Ig-like domain-containing protein [Enterococcus rotai]|uniref:Ig-like domain-containing protein n=1 Tax=Enterococcus rotai TaxID=118060 RepID=UPI0035C69218
MKNLKLGLIGIFLLGATLVGLAPESVSAVESRSVIGNDDRVQITDTTAVPYQSTVFIGANGSLGSGSVIGKNTVLTAAHVVSGIKDNPNTDSNYVIPGRNGATLPYGKFKIKEVHIFKKYLTTSSTSDDVAVLTLEPNDGKGIGDIVKQNPIVLTDTVTIGDNVSSTGYPGDKTWGTQWEAKGKIIGKQTASLIDYDFDTFGGQSGSSVFNDKYQIIAVHSAGGGNRNVGVKLNSEKIDFILEHIGEVSTPIEIAPKEIIIEKDAVELNAGDSMTLKTSVLPENTTNKQLHWETATEEIVTVDNNGNITAISPGSAWVSVTTADGKITKYIDIDVNEVAPEEIVVDQENVELSLGESMTLNASVLPTNATDKELFWLSDDATIVDVDDHGTITGKKVGATDIIILSVTNFGDIEKRITVTVKEKLKPADLTFPARIGSHFSKQEKKETREVVSNTDKLTHILFHLKKPNALYDLKIGEFDFNGGTGVYNVQAITLGKPFTQFYYTIDIDRQLADSKIVIMYVDKKNPKIVKDYFFVEKR